MADVELQDKIVRFLSGKPKKSESAGKLVNVLRIPKKSMNIQLYIMQSEGRLVKIRETPPVWGLPNHNSGVAIQPNVRTRRRIRNNLHKPQCDANEEEKIIDFISNKKKPMRPGEIAKGTGHSKASEINAMLYSMLKRGILVKKTEKPPTWDLADSQVLEACGTSAQQSADDTSLNMGPVGDVSTHDHQLSALPDIRNFQDTDLFSSDTSHFSNDTSDNLTDADSNVSTFNESQLEAAEVMSPSRLLENIENEFNDTNSQNSSTRGHDCNNSRNSGSGSEAIFGEVKYEDSNLSVENQVLGEESVRGEMSSAHSKLNEETKPKSFRDFFHLDSQSIGSRSSLDSMGSAEIAVKAENDSFNIEDGILEQMDDSYTQVEHCVEDNLVNRTVERQGKALGAMNSCVKATTPVITYHTMEKLSPECNKEVRNWSTPDIVANVLDIEDSLNRPTSNMLNDGENGNHMVVKTRGEDQDYEEMEEESNEDTDKDKSELEDMENCDKVLKILFEMKFAAQFILKKKTGFSDIDLNGLIQKCVSLNFVAGSAKLWKITPSGLEYAKNKFEPGSDRNLLDPPVPVAKVKQTFKGPPPPPKALLNKHKGSDGIGCGPEGLSDTNSGLQTGSSVRNRISSMNDSQSLFKMPGHGSEMALNRSTPNLTPQSSGLPRSQSGPQSLMSLQFDNVRQYCNKTSNQSLFADTQYQSMPSNQSQISDKSLCNESLSESYNAFPSSEISPFPDVTETSGTTPPVNSTVLKASSSIQAQKYMPYTQTTKRSTVTLPETTMNKIPEKYANYPNLSPCPQSLKTQSRSKSNERAGSRGTSSSAFSKGPPPSPMDILSKSLKKTEISPPSSLIDRTSVTSQSGSFVTLSQPSSTNNFGSTSQNTNYMSMSNFQPGRVTSTGSQNVSSVAIGKQSVTVNQSSFTQSGSLYMNYGKTSGYQAEQGTSQFNLNTGNTQFTRGPPPPPAVKLGLQSQQPMSLPTPVQKPVQSMGNANLGLALSSESFAALNKNPVSALMEYAQSRKMQARVEVISQRGSSHKPTFEMAAFVGNRRFTPVTCHNKKDGRKEACDIALRQLFAEGQFQAEKDAASGTAASMSAVPSANMTHFDTIAALTHRGFTALVSQITAESFAGRKVIAGLVMKRAPDDTGVLISLGTGNRCITGQQLSLQGNTVNDSHAEIITRRGFLRFLYKQLLEYDANRPNPMFEKSSNGKLQIRSNITFHLYISTAPCGDGALFSPRDAESSKNPVDTRIRPPHEPTFSNNVQGVLRTKVEGGEGTIPIEAGFKVQTFDGIQRGERLRTMSCTDKICRWNVVGMQGALLSHFLEPVYLDSLSLGLLYEHGHLARAVCCRVGRGNTDINAQLPSSYKLNHPWLGRVTVCDPPREVQKTKALSINWCFGDKAPEVTDGTLGLCYTSIEKGFFSRCSKRSLFTQFKSLCEKFGRQDLLQVSSYNEAKIAAVDFVAAKEAMLRRFKENGYGKWVSKPVEEEMFGFEEN